jgi:ACS family pantothenate transporter-like MFS transporter
MNSFGAMLTTLIQQFLYPVTDAPVYSKGFKASLGFILGMCCWVVAVRWFEIRALREKEEPLESGSASVSAEDGSDNGAEVGIAVTEKV